MNHQMTLEETYETGAEMWGCPICGRGMVLRWEPFKKIITAVGDENATHSGGHGIRITGTSINVAADNMSDELKGLLDGLDLD